MKVNVQLPDNPLVKVTIELTELELNELIDVLQAAARTEVVFDERQRVLADVTWRALHKAQTMAISGGIKR